MPSRCLFIHLAVVVASGLVTACSEVAPTPHSPLRPARTPPPIDDDIAVARTLHPKPQLATLQERVFVLVTPATDASKQLPQDATDELTTLVKQMAVRSGVETALPDGVPTSSDPAASGWRGFTIATRVHQLAITKVARQTRIRCNVKLRVTPYHGSDSDERWEANTTATASASALATTSTASAHVERGVRDCLEGAVEAAATRQVLPFLKRVASRPAIGKITGDRQTPTSW